MSNTPLLSDKIVLANMAKEIRYSLFANKWRIDSKESLDEALRKAFRTEVIYEDPEWLKQFKNNSSYKFHEQCNATFLKEDNGYEIYICPKNRIKMYQTLDYTYEILMMLAHGILDCKTEQRVYADAPLYWYLHGYAEERAATLVYNVLLPQEEFEAKMVKYVSRGRLNTKQMAEDMGWPHEKLLSQARRLRIIEN